MKRMLPIFFLLTWIFPLRGQELLGPSRPGLKWRQIETAYSRIIYPETSRAQAVRVANLIQTVNQQTSAMGGPSRKVPVILHNQSVLVFGVPGLAPWKSDWSLASPQMPFMGGISWLDGLTLHEYRHHQQMTLARKGWLSPILRTLAGQLGWYLNILLIQPNWFFEGDATYAESVYTHGGRGRATDFNREYRSLLLNDRQYSYDKATRGSLRDFVPNIYRQGFYITSYARRNFGNDIWERVLEDTYRRKGVFYPFSRSLRSLTGLNTRQMYRAAIAELDSLWKLDLNRHDLTEYPGVILPGTKEYVDQRFPFFTKRGLIYFREAYNEIPGFWIDQGKSNAERLFYTGHIAKPDHIDFSFNGQTLAWAEIRKHPRWFRQHFGVIMTYDFQTGKKKQLTHASSYYSPSVSPDDQTLLAIKHTDSALHQLVVLDKYGENERVIMQAGPGTTYSYPRWSQDGRYMYVSVTNANGNTIRKVSVDNKSYQDLLPYDPYVKLRVVEHGGYLYFSSGWTGMQDLFALNLNSQQIYRVTRSALGAYNPAISPDGKTLAFSEFTPDGFRIREIPVNPDNWTLYDLDSSRYAYDLNELTWEENGPLTDKVTDSAFVDTKFNYHTNGIFNVHSWVPFIGDSDYGLDFSANSILNTWQANVGIHFLTAEKSWKTLVGFSYGALWPILDAGATLGNRRSRLVYNGDISNAADWAERRVYAGLRVPLYFDHGNYSAGLETKARMHHIDITYSDDQFTDRDEKFYAVEAEANLYNIRNRAPQHLVPRFGQTLGVRYESTLDAVENKGEQLFASGELFFPGVGKNHGFFVTGSYKREEIQNAYRFENYFVNPRGYNNTLFTGREREPDAFETLHKFTLNYSLPVAFPDLALGSVAWFRSIRVDLFYDYGKGRYLDEVTLMRSTGLDLTLDVPIFRLLRTSTTLRFAHRFDVRPSDDAGNFYFDVIFNITDLAF